ncbi:28S ribosomal protein S17, mitochondrial [Diprion similis]|uniref:28S ribosomal protein S17, mitochondrial n=1 Tax=Diprion similis TaxID=362088 RepID=UPI001EF7944E|nr:28S ribosomal protein S17, mitochondrial [Diprion similis]
MAKVAVAAAQGKTALSLLLGKCVPCAKQNASKIRVQNFKLDTNLNMYYRENSFFYAHDPQALCKPGDTVLIKELPNKLTRLITHEILEIVYPLGDVTDPLTGKKVVVSKYRDDMKAEDKLFGRTDSAFDYDKAPPRGSQEDKRDFSHKETYTKYHEDPNDPQPYAV